MTNYLALFDQNESDVWTYMDANHASFTDSTGWATWRDLILSIYEANFHTFLYPSLKMIRVIGQFISWNAVFTANNTVWK